MRAADLLLQFGELCQGRVDIGQGALMQLAVSNHTLGIDDKQRSIRNPAAIVENSQFLRGRPVRPKVGQERMANTTQGHCPGLERKNGIHAQADQLSVRLIKFCQRTVER